MANEVIKVNLIPGVDDPTPILHFSQYDNGRTFIAEIYNGEDAFDCGDYNVTLECRKRDNNIVILTAAAIDNNEIIFHTTEQLCACYGENDSEIVIRDNNDLVIGSGNITINVEKSPTCGGIQSETVIDNITQQIAHIVTEVIGEDYYNKTQTDALLANKANVDDVYNKENTYTKAQVNELIDNIFPTFTASGVIASFITALNKPLVSLTADAAATTITRCGKNFWNVGIRDGYIYNGRYYPNSNYWCTESNIPVKPDTTYYLQGASGSDGQICFYDRDGVYIPNSAISSRIGSFTTPSDAYFISVYNANATRTEPKQLELGSQATAFEVYNGITVSKEQATTIETLSGVNNVFADSGSVTAQYKYMSM